MCYYMIVEVLCKDILVSQFLIEDEKNRKILKVTLCVVGGMIILYLLTGVFGLIVQIIYITRNCISDIAESKKKEEKEEVYKERDFYPADDYPYKWNKVKNKYTAFYFSNYKNPDITGLPEPMIDDLQYEFGTRGNFNSTNEKINDFMAYFFKLYDLLKKNDLPREIFDTAISDRLKSMEK